jgi:sodium-coupled neutral amino acid transporter 11
VSYMTLAKVVGRFCGFASASISVRIMSDEEAAQATAAQLAEPLLEHATDEAPVNEAPEQSAADAPEQTPEEPDEGRSTILGVGINLANAIVGSGIVGLPAALKDAGLGLGCLLLVGMAFTVHVVVVALVRDAELLKATSYGDLAKAALGSIGEVLVCGGQFVFDVGAALTYLIIFGDTAVSSVEFFVNKPCKHLRLICVAGAGMAALPPCLLRDVSGLEGISLLSR